MYVGSPAKKDPKRDPYLQNYPCTYVPWGSLRVGGGGGWGGLRQRMNDGRNFARLLNPKL